MKLIMFKRYILLFTFFANMAISQCDMQVGPEPWDYVKNVNSVAIDEDIPPDLKDKPQRKVQCNNNIAMGEWFYKRILSIVLKGGNVKKNEDGSIDISLQMKYNEDRWNILDSYIKPNTGYSEEMYRRSIGYIEEAIIKPSISEEIVFTWSKYFQHYLTEYKTHIMWATGILAGVMTVFWLWNHISHKHVIILIIFGLYLYEVLISYKEAEKEELDKFMTAVNTCKWWWWTTDCRVPPPDPLIFMKHMNPLKIGIRLFTTLVTEPMITINETMKIIIHGITDGLWFPLNKIMYGILIVTFLILLLFLMISIIFNYILNIPFNLSFLGIIRIGLIQRSRRMQNTIPNDPPSTSRSNNVDRISGENLSKLLEVYTRALNTVNSTQILQKNTPQNSNRSLTYKPKMTRSASTGRLPNHECEYFNNNNISQRYKQNGGGDAH